MKKIFFHNESRIAFSIFGGIIITFFYFETFIPFILAGKEFSARSLPVQVLLVCISVFIFSFLFFGGGELLRLFPTLEKVKPSLSGKSVFVSLFLIYIISVFITNNFITSTAYGPVHQDDENRYWNMAYELYKGTFSLSEYHIHPILYPLSILPAFFHGFPYDTYQNVKFLNAIYICSAIFPCFLILRRFTGRILSLVCTCIILLNPGHLLFPRCVLSENIYYPLLLWAIYFAIFNFSSPKSRTRYFENIAFGFSLSFLVLTRYIALAIIPSLLIIWWLKPLNEEKPPFLFSRSKAFHFLTVLLPIIAILGIWFFYGMTEGLSIKQLLGFSIASDPNPLQLTWDRLLSWFIMYSLYIVSIASPFLGGLFLAINWKKSSMSTKNEFTRWIIGISFITICLLVACTRHSWLVSYNYPTFTKLQGRYLFPLVPLFFISMIAVVTNMKKFNNNMSVFKYSIYSALAILTIIIVYLLFYESWLPIMISVILSGNSPDGFLIASLREGYVFLACLVIITIFLYFARDMRIYLTISLICLSLIFIVGNHNMFYDIILPLQEQNMGAFYLREAILKENKNFLPLETTPIKITIKPKGLFDEEVLENAFQFYGFRTIEIEPKKEMNEQYDSECLIEFAGKQHRLINVEPDKFIECNCVKYGFFDQFYIIQ